MRSNSSLKLSNEQKLKLYGYYKQAMEGACSTAKPGYFDFTGRAKWEAWHSLGDMAKEEAMRRYLAAVSTIAPDWARGTSAQAAHTGQEEEEERGGEGKGGGGGGGVGPVVSRMADQEQELAEEEKTLFDWCKEGREDRLQALLSPDNINTIDSQVMELRNTHDVIVTLIDCTQGMSLIHWACDRGHLPIVELLVSRGADVNVQDTEQQTPLHYASSCDQGDVVSYLLSNGADPTIKDCDKLTPVQVAEETSTKQLFQNCTM